MPDNASQTKFKKGNCKLYCILFITNLFLSSLLGLLIAQFFIIHTSIEDLPTFLKNGNTLFINTNSFIERNEPLFQDVLVHPCYAKKYLKYLHLQLILVQLLQTV